MTMKFSPGWLLLRYLKGGPMWWLLDVRLRAANTLFMTDNKRVLLNHANWRVLFWNGKRTRKKEITSKNWDIVSTLYYASPPCKITAMNLLKNQTRYISHIYDSRLASHLFQSDWVKFHSENTSRKCASHTEISVWELTNEMIANDLINHW